MLMGTPTHRTVAAVLVLSLASAALFVSRVARVDRRSAASPHPLGVERPAREVEPIATEEPSPASPLPERRDAEGEESAADGLDGTAAFRGMRVLVRDAVDERPIADARLTLYDRATPLLLRSERDGVCLVPVLSFLEPALLRVEAAGHFHWTREIVPTPNLVVALPRSATLSGRVLAADTGSPVAGATLALLHDSCTGCEPERVLSAVDGRFELHSVPLRRKAVLEVRAEGFAVARREFELRSDEPRVVQDIRLVRGLELSGRVEDWTSGRGIAGARVGELVTGEDGRFRGRILAQPATGRTSFAVSAPGHAMLGVALAGPSEEELVLRLPQLAFLEGRVTDIGGQPLAGARVVFEAAGPNQGIEETSPLYELSEGWAYSVESTTAESGDDGRFSLAVLPWSLHCTVGAWKRGFLSEARNLQSIGEPASKLRLDWWLKPGEEPTIVHGTVALNGQRAPFPCTVSWIGPTRSGSGRLERGSYMLEVEPGEVRFVAVLDFLPRFPSRAFVAELARGSERRLDLDVVTPAATITGSVRFEDGTPISGRAVMATRSMPSDGLTPMTIYHHALTDERGEFSLQVEDVGLQFDLATWNFEGSRLTQPGIAPGASGVDFELPRGYRVFLRAREASTGAALSVDEEVQFLARGKPTSRFWPLMPASSVADVDGWYECEVAEREADLLVLPRAGGLPLYGARLIRGVRLDGLAPARVEFELERGLDVVLELAEGVAPLPDDHDLLLLDEELWSNVYRGRGARYETLFDDLEAQCSVRFDEKGRALVRGLAPGHYRFKPRPGDLVLDPEYVRVDRGMLPVVVRWSRRE